RVLLACAFEPGRLEHGQGHAGDILFAQVERLDKGVVEQRQQRAGKERCPIVPAAALLNYGHGCTRYPVWIGELSETRPILGAFGSVCTRGDGRRSGIPKIIEVEPVVRCFAAKMLETPNI